MPDSNVIGGPAVGATITGVAVKPKTSSTGELYLSALANERDRGTSNAHGQSNEEWNRYQFNPRAASTGSTLGAAGSVGTTEVLIGGGVPVTFGGIIFESDSAAGNILLRDAVATATSLAAQSISAAPPKAGLKFLNGLCVVGTATGVSAVILWRVTGTNL